MSSARENTAVVIGVHSTARPKHQFRRWLSAGFDRKGKGKGVYRRSHADGSVEGKWRPSALVTATCDRIRLVPAEDLAVVHFKDAVVATLCDEVGFKSSPCAQ